MLCSLATILIARTAVSLSVTPVRKVTSNCKANLQINKRSPIITFVLTKSVLGSKVIRCALEGFFDVERLDLIKQKAEGRDAVQGTAVYGI